MHPLPSAAATESLRDLQHEIWLAKIARAKAMTPDERLAETVALTTQAFARMHAAALADLGTSDPEAGWAEVRRRLERLRAARDAGRFVTELPADAPAVR